MKETIEKLAVIPAKGLSSRFSYKNIRPLRHIPLFLYSVAYAVQEGFTPVVATDSDWIEFICRHQKIVKTCIMGVTLPVRIRVVRETVEESKLENCAMQVLEHYECKQLAILQPSSPIREPGLLQRMSFEMAQEGFESAFTYKPVKVQGKFQKEWKEAPIAQQAQDWLMAHTGNIVLCSPEKLAVDGSFYDDSSRGYFSEPPTDMQIDTGTDFKVVSELMDSPSFRKTYMPSCVARKIAVVANGPVTRNYSEFIDSCDLVFRVNKMEEMASGRLGTKTDVAVVSLYGSGYSYFSEHPDKLRDITVVYFNQENRRITENFCERHHIPQRFLPPQVDCSTSNFTTLGKAVLLAKFLHPDATIFLIGDRDVATRTHHSGKHLMSSENKVLELRGARGDIVFVQEDEGFMYFGDKYNAR